MTRVLTQTRTQPSLLHADALGVSVDGQAILRDVSVDLQAGEFVVIVGPNGAGKSTLLRAMAGLQRHAGRLDLEGDAVATMKPHVRARRIAYLPQGGEVHWPMPVRDIVALGRLPFGAALQRLSEEDRLQIDSAMAACSLVSIADRPVTLLSGGELSRVLLARALAADTAILLADEPAASLDPGHQIATMDLLSRRAAAGRLVVAVSHDISLALRYATRMLVLENGALLADGPPAALLDSGMMERIFGVRFHRVNSPGETLVAVGPKAL